MSTTEALLLICNAGNNVRVSIPTTAAGGPYYLLVCADDLNALAEANEANNCRASTSTVLVQ